jgi:hypothetical protein
MREVEPKNKSRLKNIRNKEQRIRDKIRNTLSASLEPGRIIETIEAKTTPGWYFSYQ